MRITPLFGVILTLVCVATAHPNSGIAGEPRTAKVIGILGGSEADEDEHPWMAAILTAGEDNLYPAQFCGGVLIDPYWVVTAGSCVYEESAAEIDIGLGYHRFGSGKGERFEVAEIILHPNFYAGDDGVHLHWHYDVALLRLARPADNFEAITIVDNSKNTSPGQRLTAYGWGARGDSGYHSSELQKIGLEIVSNSSVQDYYDFSLRDYHLSAVDPETGGDTCAGDGGGPVVVGEGDSARLAGLVSYGFPCGSTDLPAIYTNLFTLRSWVDSTIANSNLRYTRGDSVDLGGGWRFSNWLGNFNDSNYPWLFHDELGWIYVAADDDYSNRALRTTGVWLWDNQDARWLWTSGSAGSWFADTSGNFRHFVFDGSPVDVFSPGLGWATR